MSTPAIASVTDALVAMGFDKDLAGAAAAATSGRSVDAAMGVLFGGEVVAAGAGGGSEPVMTGGGGGAYKVSGPRGWCWRRVRQLRRRRWMGRPGGPACSLVPRQWAVSGRLWWWLVSGSLTAGLWAWACACAQLTIAVNDGLGMSAGKIAAQCCHAALAAYRKACDRDPTAAERWLAQGEPTVVLRAGGGAAGLAGLQDAAIAAGLASSAVADAGRTQVAPGSVTCCAFGPAAVAAVDAVTGELKLL